MSELQVPVGLMLEIQCKNSLVMEKGGMKDYKILIFTIGGNWEDEPYFEGVISFKMEKAICR